MRVLVCDDEQNRCDDISGKILEAGQPAPEQLVGKSFTKELTNFFDNIKTCLDDPQNCKGAAKSSFDDADIVVIDNNLAHLEVTGTRLTAESIAGYVRAFTNASYLVSVNKNPDVDFDLRYLVGDYSTRADLALNSNHLANVALWTGNPAEAKNGFRPWYWPTLSTVAERRRDQIAFVREHLNDAVVGVLGFDDEAIGFLSLHARGSLSPDAETDGNITKDGIPLNEVTFREVFISKDRSLPSKAERQSLSDAEKEGNAIAAEIIARVVAADIDLWFRRDVIGPQEPLVDVPHLLMRFPFLLGNRANDIKEWHKSVVTSSPPFGIEQELFANHLAKAQFQHQIWVPTPSFWWPKLKTDQKLNEFFFKAKEGDWAEAVFCEDRSAFLERSPPNPEAAAVEFPAEFEGSWGRRYVAPIDGVRYAPRTRLAM